MLIVLFVDMQEKNIEKLYLKANKIYFRTVKLLGLTIMVYNWTQLKLNMLFLTFAIYLTVKKLKLSEHNTYWVANSSTNCTGTNSEKVNFIKYLWSHIDFW